MTSNIKDDPIWVTRFNQNHKFQIINLQNKQRQEFQSLSNHLFQIPRPIIGPPSQMTINKQEPLSLSLCTHKHIVKKETSNKSNHSYMQVTITKSKPLHPQASTTTPTFTYHPPLITPFLYPTITKKNIKKKRKSKITYQPLQSDNNRKVTKDPYIQ